MREVTRKLQRTVAKVLRETAKGKVFPNGFTENLEIAEIPAAADMSHDLDPERPIRVASRKQSIYTHFPKDQNCEVCKRTDEGSESRNNHRYAVVVQDLFTHWIRPDPCKTKTSQETEMSLRKFLNPSEKPKVIYSDNSQEFWQIL